MGRAETVLLPAFLGALAVLAAGCLSGQFGARPEIRGLTEGGEGRGTVTISLELRDEDLSVASVRVEHETGEGWLPATLTVPTVGSVSPGAVTGLPLGPEWTPCEFGWDTVADGVGTAAQVTVKLRLTPCDSDGEGDPEEIAVTVDNTRPRLVLSESELFLEGTVGAPAGPGGVIHISNAGPAGTELNWAVTFEYQGAETGWLATATPTGQTTTETDAVGVTTDISGMDLGAYEATIRVEDPAADDSPAEIRVTLTVMGLASGLVGHWTFDDPGDLGHDSSGMGNHGTLHGATAASGRLGGALSFDGTDDYVSAGLNGIPAINASQTVCLWYFVSAVPGDFQCMLASMRSSNSLQVGFLDSMLTVWKYFCGKLARCDAPAPNEWHHAVYTYDGTTHRLYVDGALAGQSTNSPDSGSPTTLEFGRTNGWGEYFNGLLDDVRVYNRVLAPEEIARLAATAPVVEAGVDVTIYLPEGTVSLDATVTDDGQPDPPGAVATLWQKVSGPGDVTFGDATLEDTTATFSAAGTYVLSLTADDGETSVSDEVTIRVLDSAIPVVTSLDPVPGRVLATAPPAVVATFNRDMDPATVTAATFVLDRSGGDGTFTDGNEVAVSPAGVALTAPAEAKIDLAGVTVPEDVYRVTLSGTGSDLMTDLAGTALDGEFSGEFPSGDGLEGGDFVCTFRIGLPLPPGYISHMLHLGSLETDRVTGASIGTDYFLRAGLGPEYMQQPSPGYACDLAPASTTESPMVWTDLTDADGDGTWCEQCGDNYVMYWAIYVIAPTDRDVRIYTLHDDEVRAWMDGEASPVLSLNGSGSGQSGVFALTAGVHSFVFKLHEGGGNDYLAVRFTDPLGNDMADLFYTLTDPIPPGVANTYPADAATGVDRWSDVNITFTEPMDTSTDPAAVAMFSGGTVTGTWHWVDSYKLVFMPSAPFDGSTAYTVTLDPAVARDPTGNALAGASPFSFTTEPGGASEPSVASLNPADGGLGAVLSGVTVTGSGFEQGPIVHPPGALLFDGHYYEYVSEAKNWHPARDDCIARGGHLATISGSQENSFVVSLVSASRSWLGFTDESVEGDWDWVSGEPATYTNWYPGEPNNSGNEDFAELRTPDSQWNDIPAGELRSYVCEYDHRDVPTVHLAKAGSPDILATNVQYVDQGTLVFDIDLAGAATGFWDVVVTNPDGASAALPDGFEVRPMVGVAATDDLANEAAADTGKFTITRTGDTSADLVVTYSVGGTAIDADYDEALSGTVTIPGGLVSATITITPVADGEEEGREYVSLSLVAGVAYSLNPVLAVATVDILDGDLPAGLVGWWKLDDGSGGVARDWSNYGHNGTLSGGPVWTSGHVDGALAFDGIDDYVDAAIDVSETSYALSLWFSTTDGNCGVFSVDDGTLGSGGHDRHVYLSAGNVCTRVHSGETIGTSGVDCADGNWHHVVHTFGGTEGGQKIYVDGVLAATGAKSGSDFDWQTGVNIGYSNDAANKAFDGLIDDVRVYDRALTDIEVHFLASSVPIVDAGPDQTVDAFVSAATLDATVIDDGMPGPLSLLWLKVSGPGSVTFNNPNAAFTGVIFGASGVYVLKLTADDGANVASDEIEITVWDSSLPTVSVTATDASGSEDGDAARFTVARTGDTTGALTVSYCLSGTADATDYIPSLSGHVTIDPGLASGDIDIVPVDDDTDEGTEVLTLAIVSTADYNTDAVSGAADISILDNDIVLSDGLVAYWRLDETAGTVATDATGNGYDGTLVNGPIWSTGKRNGALSFDGSDDYVNVPGSPDVAGGSFSVAAWIYRVDGAERKFVSKWNDNSGNYQFDCQVYSDEKLWFQVRQADNSGKVARGTTVIERNAWRHFVGVADASTGTLHIYLDGLEEKLQSSPDWDGTVRSVAMELNIGRKATGNHHWNGLLDEVRLYDRALTAGEVRLLATSVPVVDAGADLTITWPTNTAALDGTAVDDKLPDPPGALTTLWEKVSGPGTVAFADAAAVDTTATFSGAGVYVLRLTADDGANVADDQVTITVYDPALSTVGIAVSDQYGAEEGPATACFTLNRTAPTTAALDVQYAVSGTAGPADYVEALGGLATIPAGQSSLDLVITPVADGLTEGAETLVLTLVSQTTYNLDTGALDAQVLLTDLDGDPDLIGFADSAWPGRGRDRRCTGRSPYVGPQTSRIEWTYSMTWGFGYFAPVIDADGVIYTGCWDDKFHAINPDGTRKWLYTGKGCLSPCVAADGTVYWGAPGNRLVALDPADGHELWSFDVGSGTPGLHLTPNLGFDGTIHLNLSNGEVVAINPGGTEKWRFPTGASVSTSLCMARDGTIYAGNDNGLIFAINPDGTEKWRFQAAGGAGTGSAVGDDGTVYMPAGGYLCALNPSGTEKWRYHIAAGRGPSVAPDGTIVVKTGGSYAEGNGFVAINPDGTRRWHYANGQNILIRPAIGADGTVYVASWDSQIRALRIEDGSQKWSLDTGGWIESHPFIGADGTLYIGSNSGKLYAIKDP